ncbi:OmpP1/FadL family transporter [Motilimonas eburnea]|uniref:OmpP1/FadL family transporter n=1 Tax=Motilimonas eburnea TaxID=1737488 RepID=UPI001E490F11|nr:outer membrane protein transport protein [Motilimonas eburnea]MCE2572890.1 outer membrane protein transport protein [Motilimonas eburnea]
MATKKNIRVSVLALTLPVSISTFGAGLSLSQIGTAKSVATAGVASVTTRGDSAASVLNPAGIASISDTAWQVGIQVIDVRADFDNNFGSASSSETLPVPHISYAKRINSDIVLGGAIHAPGGLGLTYENGFWGVGNRAVIDKTEIALVDATFAVGYEVNENLVVGIGLIARYGAMKLDLFQQGQLSKELSDGDIAPAFNLGLQYQNPQGWTLGLSYRSGSKHALDFGSSPSVPEEIRWPQIVDAGFDIPLTLYTSLMASVNWQDWSETGDGFGYNYEDTYGFGLAIEHHYQDWVLMTGVSFDSSPIESPLDRTLDLPLDKQWRLGLGAEKQIWGDKYIGIAYQYSDLGSAEVERPSTGSGYLVRGSFSQNYAHFIALSLRY